MRFMNIPISWSNYGDEMYRKDQYVYGAKAAGLGALGAAGATASLLLLGQRRIPALRRVHSSVNICSVVMAGLFAGVFTADKAGLRFERLHRTDEGTAVLTNAQRSEQQIWNTLTLREKALTWIKDNQACTVTTGGALSLALFALFMRRQPMTLAQKLVQARVYAQGVTLASALCMAHFVPKPDDELHRARDYAENNSWKSVLHVQGLLNDYE